MFLDRDGVINEPIVRDGRPFSPMSLDEFKIYPEAADACQRLRSAGFRLVVVTNQPEVSRGTLDPAVLEAMHDVLRGVVDVDLIVVCPHDDADRCSCRKPKPGMLVEGAERLGIDLSRSVMVGDRWRDVEAGRAAGCETLFVDRGWQEMQPKTVDGSVRSIAEAAEWVLATPDPGATI